jgi:outer membrane protein OmpA-like peptidoglycan-associated protein
MGKSSVKRTLQVVISVTVGVLIGVAMPDSGYSQFQPGEKRNVAEGEKLKLKGVVLTRDGETFILRDRTKTDTVVLLTDTTKIRTERKGLFRGRKPADVTVLIPGLIVQANGKGAGGRLVAEEIEFSEDDLKMAIMAYGQTAPLRQQAAETNKELAKTQGELSESKKQLGETKKQLGETKKELSETNKQLAATSQEVVDTNKRINELDQYELVKVVTLPFDLNSAKLTDAAKAQLDELASKAPGAKNYLVEVQGFTDPTGDFNKNLKLSQDRADAVVQYLTVKHQIPLRRIMVPMGYGETKMLDTSPAAASLAKNRRVEVRVMVNKGLNQ